MWLHRLSAVEKAASYRLVVFAPKANAVIPTYAGPEVRFLRVDGKLVEEACPTSRPM